jgi:hypothetical protein
MSFRLLPKNVTHKILPVVLYGFEIVSQLSEEHRLLAKHDDDLVKEDE